MGYGVSRIMGYGFEIPTYQAGGQTKLWDIRGYGLSRLWVKRGSTVYRLGILLFGLGYASNLSAQPVNKGHEVSKFLHQQEMWHNYQDRDQSFKVKIFWSGPTPHGIID